MYRTALARTHRPRRFEELVGQDHVAETLRVAVESGRVAHAYLFAGPRGVGKTTAARVLAMSLNCPNREDGEPCGTCESCDRIWAGRTSLDVVEIDAASHRGVDDARDLRERAMYAPTSDDRYKIYILDEAHMLTRDAWNALLKILEEPPPRVVFAFATTEPQKIERGAAPVMSRCQRFDFRRVTVPDIVGRLETVLGREGVESEPGALTAIARRADGGVRDALSLLDQVLSFTGDRVAQDDVRRMLGLVEDERYLAFFDLVARRDRPGVFAYVQELLDAGYDPAEFVRGLGDALRALLVVRLDPGSETVELLPDVRERFIRASASFSPADVVRMLVAVSEFESDGTLQRSAQQRIQLEVLLLRLVSMDSTVELEQLLDALGGGGSSGADRRPAPSPRPAPEAPRTPPASGSPPASVPGGSAGGQPQPSADPRTPGADAGNGSASPRAAGAGRAPAGPGGDLERARRAWAVGLNGATGLGGWAVALRGAVVTACEAGTLHLQLPAGLFDELSSLLSDRTRSASLREGIAGALGLAAGDVRLEPVRDAAPSRRMTAREATEQRVRNWMDRDPGLKRAVETLDLTLNE